MVAASWFARLMIGITSLDLLLARWTLERGCEHSNAIAFGYSRLYFPSCCTILDLSKLSILGNNPLHRMRLRAATSFSREHTKSFGGGFPAIRAVPSSST
jgi:hypothetical protein